MPPSFSFFGVRRVLCLQHGVRTLLRLQLRPYLPCVCGAQFMKMMHGKLQEDLYPCAQHVKEGEAMIPCQSCDAVEGDVCYISGALLRVQACLCCDRQCGHVSSQVAWHALSPVCERERIKEGANVEGTKPNINIRMTLLFNRRGWPAPYFQPKPLRGCREPPFVLAPVPSKLLPASCACRS